AERDVAAAVDERVMLTAPVDDETLDVLAAHGKGELLRFSRRDFADAGDVQQRGHHASVPKNACPRSPYLTQRIARDVSADSARFHHDQYLFVRSERSRLVISSITMRRTLCVLGCVLAVLVGEASAAELADFVG